MKCVHNCKQNVDNLRVLQGLKEDMARALAVQKLLALEPDIVFKEWKVYPEFDAWEVEQEKVKLRQDVCVFVGPTKTGKTEFAMAKCGKDTLVVNCHNVTEPDLRKFAGAHKHKSLILDEGGPKLLSLHRDLLQASKRDITLGHSNTNRWTYTVNLFRVRIIITSNEWYDELAKLPQKDQDWIEGNTVMIHVDSPTYVKEEQASCMSVLILNSYCSCLFSGKPWGSLVIAGLNTFITVTGQHLYCYLLYYLCACNSSNMRRRRSPRKRQARARGSSLLPAASSESVRSGA